MASELPRDTGLAGSGHWPHTGPPSGTGLSWGHKRRAPAPPAGCHAQQQDTALLQPHQDLAALSTQASPRAWTQQAVSSLGKARGLLSLSAPTTSSSTVSLPSLRVYFQPHCYPPHYVPDTSCSSKSPRANSSASDPAGKMVIA